MGQGERRAAILRRRTVDEQIKYCILIEGASILRKEIQHNPESQRILHWSSCLPSSYRERMNVSHALGDGQKASFDEHETDKQTIAPEDGSVSESDTTEAQIKGSSELALQVGNKNVSIEVENPEFVTNLSKVSNKTFPPKEGIETPGAEILTEISYYESRKNIPETRIDSDANPNCDSHARNKDSPQKKVSNRTTEPSQELSPSESLSRCTSEAVRFIIGENFSKAVARGLTHLQKDVMAFYCVLLGITDKLPKAGKNILLCMLTNFFYTSLFNRYIGPHKREQPSPPRATAVSSELPRKSKRIKDKAFLVQKEVASDTRTEGVEAIVKPRKAKSQETKYDYHLRDEETFSRSSLTNSTAVNLSNTPFPTHVANHDITSQHELSDHEPSGGLLQKYVPYFYEAFEKSPILPLASVRECVALRLGADPPISELRSVARQLHDLQQIAYCVSDDIMYVI